MVGKKKTYAGATAVGTVRVASSNVASGGDEGDGSAKGLAADSTRRQTRKKIWWAQGNLTASVPTVNSKGGVVVTVAKTPNPSLQDIPFK